VKRSELAHILRSSSELAGDPGILVIGSQAILASFDESHLPIDAVRSIEADIAFFNDPHDLVVSKLVAGRPKDHEFARALLGAGLVDVDVLRARAASPRHPGHQAEGDRLVGYRRAAVAKIDAR
jgi:hypothetical protein